MHKYLPFIMYYGSAFLLFTRKVHCLKTFWHVTALWVITPYSGTKFQTCISYRSLHVGLSDPTCVQNFRPVPLTVFEIQGFKLKNKNDKIF